PQRSGGICGYNFLAHHQLILQQKLAHAVTTSAASCDSRMPAHEDSSAATESEIAEPFGVKISSIGPPVVPMSRTVTDPNWPQTSVNRVNAASVQVTTTALASSLNSSMATASPSIWSRL